MKNFFIKIKLNTKSNNLLKLCDNYKLSKEEKNI